MNAKAFVSITAAVILASLLGCSTPNRAGSVQSPAVPPNSEPLCFTIFRLSGDGRVLLAQGKLHYTLQDIDVVKWGNREGLPSWKKSLKLANGFSIGSLVVRSAAVPGFGLWIHDEHHPAGFSWEWFNVEAGDTYKKLQGAGRVRVTQAEYLDGVEIRSVEFLTDVTLRFQDDVKKGPRNETHEVMVSKGSVLRFAP